MTNKISYLDDGEFCILTKDNVEFYDVKKIKLIKKFLISDDKNIVKKVIIKILCQKKFLSNQLH